MIDITSDVALLHGDVKYALPMIPDESVDCVVTDPPYALDMGGGTKGWDKYGPLEFSLWCQSWAKECLRISKPGSWLLAAGSARTVHRLTVGIEDAGWEIVDGIKWLYSTSFERSVDLSARLVKAGFIDVARDVSGLATYLKSRHEPFVLARAPMPRGLVATVAEYGTAMLDVTSTDTPSGAGPSNVVVSHAFECTEGLQCVSWCPVFQLGPHGHLFPSFYWADKPGKGERPRVEVEIGKGTGKLSTIGELRRWVCATCGTPTQSKNKDSNHFSSVPHKVCDCANYVPIKTNDYSSVIEHNTVKPLQLVRWLIRLVCPPEGRILEPFAGSGSGVEAAVLEGRKVIAVERSADSMELVRSRLRRSRCALSSPYQLTNGVSFEGV